MTNAFKDIDKLESDLWVAVDNLRANSKLTPSDYSLPVLSIIFLRHAANRLKAARRQIAETITAYQDEHTLTGKCAFVMVNAPFNGSDWRRTAVSGCGE